MTTTLAERFETLWNAEERSVARFVAYRLRYASAEDREDVVARTMHEAWRTFALFGQRRFAPWVMTIAHRACVDWVRSDVSSKRAATRTALLETLADPSPSPFHLATRNDLSPGMARALGELIPRHRRALRMIADGAGRHDVAATFRCSPQRAGQIVNAARAKAASYLA